MFPSNMVGNFHTLFLQQVQTKFKGDSRLEFHQFLTIIFVDFMEKEPLTKFCAILITFQEVMKLVFNILLVS